MEEKRYVITLTLAALSWLSFFCWIVVFATTHYVEKMYWFVKDVSLESRLLEMRLFNLIQFMNQL